MSGASPFSPWTLIVVGPGNQEVSRAAMRVGVPITIGRAPENTVMLGMIAVARHHGRIELVNGVPHYFNEPGATGARVDGDPVADSTPLGERTQLEIGPYQFTLQRARTAAAAPRPAAPGWSGPTIGEGRTLLDRHVQGVRTHRAESQKGVAARSARWEQEWKKLIDQVREIQTHYGGHPRFLEFSITPGDREVIIKLREDSVRGHAYFLLSRMHPDGKFQDLEAVWLREVGREDAYFNEPLGGLEEMLARIAPRLA